MHNHEGEMMSAMNEVKNLNELQPMGQTEATIFGKRAEQMLAVAKECIIDCQEVAEVVSLDLKEVKLLAKEIEEKRLSITRPLDQVKTAIMNLFKPATTYLEQAEQVLTAQLRAWDDKVKAERAALEAEQRKLREAEAQRLREQQNAAAKLAEEAAQATRAATSAASVAEANEKIAAAKKAALVAQTYALQAKMTATAILPAATKLSGATRRENWQFNVVDLDLVPREYLCLDEKKVNAVVKAMKDKTAIPGIEVYDEGTYARTRK